MSFTFISRCRWWRLFTVPVLLLGSLPATGAETLSSAKEYQIKAAYIAKLSSFITWPDRRFSSSSDNLKICILGDDPFTNSIDLAAKQMSKKGRSVAIQRLPGNADSTNCHIVFISQSEQRSVPFILGRLMEQPILTISDTDAFLKQGGMVEFYTNAQRQIRLQIDPETVQERGLKVNANLLAISRKKD